MVNILIKKDYFAYITSDDIKIFNSIIKSFTRQVRQYNNWTKRWDDKIDKHYSLVDKGNTIKVKAGLVDFLRNSFEQNNIQYNLKDERKYCDSNLKVITQLNKDVILRDYQETAVKNVFNNPYSCIQIMTAGGKTECSASIFKTYFTKYNDAVLYVVPTLKLQEESENRFIQYGLKVNRKLPIKDNCINILTYMALVRSDIKLDNIGAVIFDECHHLKGDKSSKIIHKFRNLKLCVGVSATITPDIQYKQQLKQLNNNDFNILGSTGKPVYWKETIETINEKFVTPIDITILKNPEYIYLSDNKIADWQIVKQKVLMSPNRTKLISDFLRYVCKQNNYHTVMLLIPEIDWSKELMLEVASVGDKSYEYILMFGQNIFMKVLDGCLVDITDNKEKEKLYNDIKNPNIKTIFSATSFAYEGLNIKNLQALLNVYGGRSDIRIKQQIGRLSRLFENKNKGHVYELYDNNPVCKSQLRKRLNIYKNEYNADIIVSDFVEGQN